MGLRKLLVRIRCYFQFNCCKKEKVTNQLKQVIPTLSESVFNKEDYDKYYNRIDYDSD